jgi:hypothetical protein
MLSVVRAYVVRALCFARARKRVEISQAAIDLIIAWEVSGGDTTASRSSYERSYAHPTWPGNAASGLTIGIGYDLRFASATFEDDWKSRLDALSSPNGAYTRLTHHLGIPGSHSAEIETRDILIPWDDAMVVFGVRRLPVYIEETRVGFPGVEKMSPDVRGALSSMVYDCGMGTQRANQVLKAAAYAAIRKAVGDNDAQEVAAGIRMMKAFHDATSTVATGLDRRREAEAKLAERIKETGEIPMSFTA